MSDFGVRKPRLRLDLRRAVLGGSNGKHSGKHGFPDNKAAARLPHSILNAPFPSPYEMRLCHHQPLTEFHAVLWSAQAMLAP